MNPGSQKLTIGGEIKHAEFHLANCLVLLDLAMNDFKQPAERNYIVEVRSRLAVALMYCKNVSNNPNAMVKL